MKTLYLDIFSGISGDMFVAALIDLGVPPAVLERELDKLHLAGYHLHIGRQTKANIAGVKFDVHLHTHDSGHEHAHHAQEDEAGHATHAPGHGHDHGHDHGHAHDHGHSHAHQAHAGEPALPSHDHEHEHGHGHDHDQAHGHTPATKHAADGHTHDDSRSFAQIRELIAASALSVWVKEKALGVFQRIAVAEGRIHGQPPEEVHFHEVGAVDSIVDIVAACVGLEALGRPRVLAGPVVEGTGWIHCAHGRFPIPAPATLQILGARGIPLTQCEEPQELITPTGAALLAEFAESFGPMTGLVAERIGFGLGTRDNHTRPNVLRAILGETAGNSTSDNDWEIDTVAVLETNLDDISAEWLGFFVERALGAGALDVFHTPIQMKKNRPGVLLTVLCPQAEADRFSELILRETSAFGLRRSTAERRKLARDFAQVSTRFGEVTVKLGKLNGRVIQAAPEFEACRRIALEQGVPIREVYEAVRDAVKVG